MTLLLACPITRYIMTLLLKTLKLRKNKRYTPTFTGLYAFYKPYWLDSEQNIQSYESYRKTVHTPLQEIDNENIREFLPYGEDAYLHDMMKQKHCVIHLASVGAVDLGKSLATTAKTEFLKGMYAAYHNCNIYAVVLLQVFVFNRFSFFRGYCYARHT